MMLLYSTLSYKNLRGALNRLSKKVPRDKALMLIARAVSEMDLHPREIGRVLRFLEREFKKELAGKSGHDYHFALSNMMQAMYYLREQSGKYLEYVEKRKKRIPSLSDFFRLKRDFFDHLKKTEDPELILSDIEGFVEDYLQKGDRISAEMAVKIGRKILFDTDYEKIPLLREALGKFLDEKAPVVYYTPEHILKHGKDKDMEEFFNKIHDLLEHGKKKEAENMIKTLFKEEPVDKFEKMVSTAYHVAEKHPHKAETAYHIIERALEHPKLINSFARLFVKNPDEAVRKLKSTASVVEILPLGGVKRRGTVEIRDEQAAKKNLRRKEKILDMIQIHLGYKPV